MSWAGPQVRPLGGKLRGQPASTRVVRAGSRRGPEVRAAACPAPGRDPGCWLRHRPAAGQARLCLSPSACGGCRCLHRDDQERRHRAGCSSGPLRGLRCRATAFAEAVFDLVLATLSVSHWSDKVAGLAEISRVMAPDAILVAADVCSTRGFRPMIGWSRRGRFRFPDELPVLISADGLHVEHIEPIRSVASIADAALIAARTGRRHRDPWSGNPGSERPAGSAGSQSIRVRGQRESRNRLTGSALSSIRRLRWRPGRWRQPGTK